MAINIGTLNDRIAGVLAVGSAVLNRSQGKVCNCHFVEKCRCRRNR